ncbi:MAG: hypothetical protein M3003_15185, partial [Candidatus Dormibacteraeota bacterium]|nr:hypothetical protein [Candidatus Dormibacteraeota bacterium]
VINTGCPDALDVDRIVREAAGMALSDVDKTYIDQRIREIILGEPALTVTATKRWLVSHTEVQAKAPESAPTKDDVLAGHGRGT